MEGLLTPMLLFMSEVTRANLIGDRRSANDRSAEGVCFLEDTTNCREERCPLPPQGTCPCRYPDRSAGHLRKTWPILSVKMSLNGRELLHRDLLEKLGHRGRMEGPAEVVASASAVVILMIDAVALRRACGLHSDLDASRRLVARAREYQNKVAILRACLQTTLGTTSRAKELGESLQSSLPIRTCPEYLSRFDRSRTAQMRRHWFSTLSWHLTRILDLEERQSTGAVSLTVGKETCSFSFEPQVSTCIPHFSRSRL